MLKRKLNLNMAAEVVNEGVSQCVCMFRIIRGQAGEGELKLNVCVA